MSKAEWGVKRRCANCDTRFYDMQRTPIRCPKCDAVFVATAMSAAPARGPRSRAMRPYVPATFGAAAAEPDGQVEETDDEVADDEGEIEHDDVGDEPEDDDLDAEDEADKPER